MKESNTPIRLGLMPPLTGLVGIYGEEISRAGLIACEEINESGGVLGRELELIIEDDGSLPESSVAAGHKLVVNHQCQAIIGNLLSNSRIAVAYRVAEPFRIPYLNFSFYEGSILSRYFFHFAALPNQQIDQMIPYMARHHGKRMFFAGNNYEWPRGSIHAAKLALEAAGGDIVGEEYLPIAVETKLIHSLLDKLEQSSPDVFVPYFAGNDQVSLLTEFTKRRLKDKMAVVMGHYDEVMASQLSPEVRDGFYSSNSYFMTVNTPENDNYLKRLSRFPGVDGIWPKGNGFLTNFGEGTYICVKAFAQAANEAGSTDPEDLVEALKTISVNAPQGRVSQNPDHHHARVNTYLSKCDRDGVFSVIEEFGAIEPNLPGRYKHQKIQLNITLEENIRLQARMLEQLSEGILLIDSLDRTIVYANAGAEKLFGYSDGELLGHLVDEINISQDIPDLDNFNELINTAIHKGSSTGNIRNIHKNGTVIWCAISINSFTHPVFGEVWLAVYRDITRQKLAEEQVMYHIQELERVNQGLEEFNYVASHDLKEPLRTLSSFSSFLKKDLGENLTPQVEQDLQFIIEAAERMNHTVNDMLELSRADRQDLSISKISLASCVKNVLKDIDTQLSESGGTVEWNELPEVQGDFTQLSRVFLNLISNALKYQDGKAPKVNISAKKSNIFWQVTVEDNGIGIEKQYLDIIFLPFKRLHGIAEYKGSGIGLSICKKIIERHGGQIHAESEPGRGTRFIFTLRA